MNRTTILMDAAYLLPQPRQSMSQRLSDFGSNLWSGSEPGARRLEQVREGILSELNGRDGCLAQVYGQVVRANDITDLWFLRSPLAAALTIDRGADSASVSMQGITTLFNGLITKQMAERRSSLNH